MFINVWLNRENALDVQPTRDRVNSIETLEIGFENQIMNLTAYQSKGKL